MSANTGGPAFPCDRDYGPKLDSAEGMTLRAYFAGQALMGMMASRNPNSPTFLPEQDAQYVVAVADALIAELVK